MFKISLGEIKIKRSLSLATEKKRFKAPLLLRFVNATQARPLILSVKFSIIKSSFNASVDQLQSEALPSLFEVNKQ